MSEKIVKDVWGSRFVKWVAVDVAGLAGGILLLLDCQHVAVSNSWKGEFSVFAEVEDLASNSKWLITLVYGLNSSSKRVDL